MWIPCLRIRISFLLPVFQTRLDYGSCVWVQASVLLLPVVQTRLDCGSLSVYKHQSPPVSQTRLIMVACLWA